MTAYLFPMDGAWMLKVAQQGIYVDSKEEGKLNGLPVNRTATLMYKYSIVWEENKHPVFADIVVGDVLFMTDEEFQLEEKLMEEDEEKES